MDDKLRVPFMSCLLIAILGGGLFGYTTGIIAVVLDSIVVDFQLNTIGISILVSSILFGAFVGCILSSYCVDKLGYTWSLRACSLFYAISILICLITNNSYLFILARVLTGMAVGMSSVIIPIFLAEVSTNKHRGKWIIVNIAAVTIGMLVSYLSGSSISALNWHYGFILPFIAAVVLLMTTVSLPILKNNSRQSNISIKVFYQDLKKHKYLSKVLAVGITLAILQQSCGINIYLYYGPKLLSMIFVNRLVDPTYIVIGFGIVNVIMTLVSVVLVDKLGRKPILMLGLICMFISQLMCLLGMHLSHFHILIISLLIFVASFAFSLGGLFWLITSEIFPKQYKGTLMGIASATNWLANTIVIATFLPLVAHLDLAITMSIYAANTLFAIIFCYNVIPETKGVPLNLIEYNLKAGKRLKKLGEVL